MVAFLSVVKLAGGYDVVDIVFYSKLIDVFGFSTPALLTPRLVTDPDPTLLFTVPARAI